MATGKNRKSVGIERKTVRQPLGLRIVTAAVTRYVLRIIRVDSAPRCCIHARREIAAKHFLADSQRC